METINAKNTASFTPRELDVMQLLMHLKTRMQISELLEISYYTVNSHMYSIYKKAGLHKQVEIIAYARDKVFGKIEVTDGS
jgi:DNA-binding CsgD family transcriptional regulator